MQYFAYSSGLMKWGRSCQVILSRSGSFLFLMGSCRPGGIVYMIMCEWDTILTPQKDTLEFCVHLCYMYPLDAAQLNFTTSARYSKRPLASKMRILCFLRWARFFEKILTVRKMYRKKQKVTIFCRFILENHFGSHPNAQNSEKILNLNLLTMPFFQFFSFFNASDIISQ